MNPQSASDCQGLRDLCRRLLAPGGCDWDRRQTVESLTPYIVEEAHEVVEACAAGDDARIAEELGDLLYLVIFMASIAELSGRFTFEDVVRNISTKLIARHPHVFGASDRDLDFQQARRQWETIKRAEKNRHGERGDTLAPGASSLPALLLAYRVQEKAASFGFDWPDPAAVVAKLEEECAELRTELTPINKAGAEEETGDILFTAVNIARHLQADPDLLLRRAVAKFRLRFAAMEARLEDMGTSLAEADLDTMERAWQAAKTDS